MTQATDPYLRERLADLEDLANRLQQHLAGHRITAAAAELPEEFILVARSMGPAELLDYDRRRLQGAGAGGGLARRPCRDRGARARHSGRRPGQGRAGPSREPAISSSSTATRRQVMLRPGEDVQQAVEARLEARRGQRQRYAELRDLPAETRGRRARRAAAQCRPAARSALSRRDRRRRHRPVPHRVAVHAARAASRRSQQQAALYRRVLDQAGDRPVTFRTLDIGGDKLLPYMPDIADENPAMGWRAIRIGLDRPAMLRQQLRALIRAAVRAAAAGDVPDGRRGRRVRGGARDPRARAGARRRRSSRAPPAAVEVGVMLEVPALLWQLPRCSRASISSRSAPTIWCSSSSPPTAAIRGSPTATIRCRRRCCACSSEMVAACDRARTCRSRCAAKWRASRSTPWR